MYLPFYIVKYYCFSYINDDISYFTFCEYLY